MRHIRMKTSYGRHFDRDTRSDLQRGHTAVILSMRCSPSDPFRGQSWLSHKRTHLKALEPAFARKISQLAEIYLWSARCHNGVKNTWTSLVEKKWRDAGGFGA